MKDLDEKPVVTVHPYGDMDVCTKFHGNGSNSCWDLSLKTNLVMALKEKSGDDQKNKDISSGNHKCLYKMLCQSIELMLR